MNKDDTMNKNHEQECIPMKTFLIRALALSAALALPIPGVCAGPAGQAGKLAATAATKAVVGRTIRESAERAAREAAEKVAREAAERAAREAAERGAREIAERTAREAAEKAARETAERGARKAATSKIVREVARPGNILAVGTATAAMIGSHNVSKGLRNSAETVGSGIGKGIETVAEKDPELLPRVIREGVSPVTSFSRAIQSLVLLVLCLFAGWFGMPVLKSLRGRMARAVARAERPSASTLHPGGGDGEVVDAECEIRG